MKQYKTLFFKNKKDFTGSDYYREFESVSELKEWCNSVKNECNHERYTYEVISLKEFLKNI